MDTITNSRTPGAIHGRSAVSSNTAPTQREWTQPADCRQPWEGGAGAHWPAGCEKGGVSPVVGCWLNRSKPTTGGHRGRKQSRSAGSARHHSAGPSWSCDFAIGGNPSKSVATGDTATSVFPTAEAGSAGTTNAGRPRSWARRTSVRASARPLNSGANSHDTNSGVRNNPGTSIRSTVISGRLRVGAGVAGGFHRCGNAIIHRSPCDKRLHARGRDAAGAPSDDRWRADTEAASNGRWATERCDQACCFGVHLRMIGTATGGMQAAATSGGGSLA